MLGATELIIGYTLVILLSVPFGLILVRAFFPQSLERPKLASVFVVALLTGLPFPVGLLWMISQISFSVVTIFLTGALAYTLLIAVVVKYPLSSAESKSKRLRLYSFENLVFVFFLLISFGYFGFTALYMGWPQVGDPWSVGTMVSLIIENGHLPATYEPISSTAMGYPLGFPVLCAAVSAVTGCLPAISLLVVASLLMGLIPVAIAWLAFRMQESLVSAAFAFLLSFYLHPIVIARYSLYYYFLNGTYTIMLGIIIVFAALAITSLTRLSGDSSHSLAQFSVLTFLSFTCFVVYPSLSPIPILLLVFLVSQELRNERVTLTRNMMLAISGIIVTLGVATLMAYLGGHFQFIFDILGRSEHLVDFHIGDGYFTVGMTGIFVAIAAATAVYRIIHESNRIPDVVFLGLLAATLLSLHDDLYRIGFNILLPSRMVIMLTLWSYVYVPIAFSFLARRYFDRRKPESLAERILELESSILGLKHEIEGFSEALSRQHKSLSSFRLRASIRQRMNRLNGFKLVSLLFLLVIMGPSLASICSFEITQQKSWFVRSPVFADDLAGMLYVKESFGPSDVIMNYQSFSDLFLPSIGVLNVVFDFVSDKDRAFELSRIWDDPYNSSQTQELLQKYNISAVYVSSVYSVLDTVNRTSGVHSRPLPQSEYLLAFGSYDFLEEVFTQGACAVYRVVKPLL